MSMREHEEDKIRQQRTRQMKTNRRRPSTENDLAFLLSIKYYQSVHHLVTSDYEVGFEKYMLNMFSYKNVFTKFEKHFTFLRNKSQIKLGDSNKKIKKKGKQIDVCVNMGKEGYYKTDKLHFAILSL